MTSWRHRNRYAVSRGARKRIPELRHAPVCSPPREKTRAPRAADLCLSTRVTRGKSKDKLEGIFDGAASGRRRFSERPKATSWTSVDRSMVQSPSSENNGNNATSELIKCAGGESRKRHQLRRNPCKIPNAQKRKKIPTCKSPKQPSSARPLVQPKSQDRVATIIPWADHWSNARKELSSSTTSWANACRL